MVAFIAAQVLVILVAVVAVSMTSNWSAVWHFFVTLTAPALTGVLAALAAAGLGRVRQRSPGHRLTAGSCADGQAAGSTRTFRPVRAAATAIASAALARPNRPVTSEASSTWPPVASLIARG